jgi:probable F420-dependent oxidoreductase
VLVSVNLPVDDGVTADDLARCALAAEHAGIDAVFVTDHPAPPEQWLRRGGHATLDPFVALSIAAGATTRLCLHTNLMVLGYRQPLLAAKAVASLDAVSGGRVILGVGVGYLRAEFEALGVGFDDRGSRADDALVAMRAAWTGEPQGPDGVVIRPLPLQRPHPPIWVGGNSRRAMRRAVEHGQGWAPMPSPRAAEALLGTPGIETVDELGKRIVALGHMAEEAGRSEPLDVVVIPSSLSGFSGERWTAEAVVDEIGRLREVGGTALVVDLRAPGVSAWLDEIGRFVDEVLSAVR